jgi:arabinan endo-1,5-alpha-L-arabinosidase
MLSVSSPILPLERMTTVRRALLLTVTAALVALAGVITAPAAAAAPNTGQLRGDLSTHDPALIRGTHGQDWYVFSSGKAQFGGAIEIRSSKDGRTWKYVGTIWDKIPSWLTDTVPGANTMWAPDIHEHDGTYYLYYAVSTVGKNNSVIALATNTTLDPTDPNYRWVDQGKVVRSVPASNFNAIDPGIVEDAAGTPWLVFGSYWSGIQMVQLEWPTGKRSSDPARLQLADRKLAPNAIEAPSIVSHDGWYYLFTSWDRCCQGTDSTYKIVVGRSQQVTGPYVDRDGRSLLDGGGTLIKSSSGSHVGPGGQSVSGKFIAYHYYDATADGAQTLGLQRLSWTKDGWPALSDGKD